MDYSICIDMIDCIDMVYCIDMVENYIQPFFYSSGRKEKRNTKKGTVYSPLKAIFSCLSR